MRGKRPSTELEHLESGLGNAEDPYYLKPLADKSVRELAELVRTEIRYTALTMIRAGRYFKAIKEKLGHGKWEDFVPTQGWSWNYVRCAMKLLEVAARYPQAIHLPPGRVTARIYHLPMPKIEELFEDLPRDAIKKLTPWDLEKIYNDKRLEESRKRKPRKSHRMPTEDELPTELVNLVVQAQTALNAIADLKIPEREYKQALRYQMQLVRSWERASYNLTDPKHKKEPWWELDPMHDDITEETPE